MQARLRDYFSRRGDIRLALLFGSLARGQGRPDSDLDVAVRFAAGRRQPGLEHPRFAVAADLPPLVGRRVDVVDLDEAPPGLAWAVAAEGVLVWEAEPGLATDFRAAAYDRYCDTAPLRRLRETYVLDALRGPRR